jgi:hypothetical protein
MRVSLVALSFAVGIGFVCCQSAGGAPASPSAIKEGAATTSAMQETQYAYRRTKRGFEKCYNRNRFGSRRWRRLFSSVPYC